MEWNTINLSECTIRDYHHYAHILNTPLKPASFSTEANKSSCFLAMNITLFLTHGDEVHRLRWISLPLVSVALQLPGHQEFGYSIYAWDKPNWFSSKTACLKGRSYEFKHVGRSVIIYGQGPLVRVATTTAAIQPLGEFVC